jgi:hypothetical protein
MVVFFALLAALALAGIVATVAKLADKRPERQPTRYSGHRAL